MGNKSQFTSFKEKVKGSPSLKQLWSKPIGVVNQILRNFLAIFDLDEMSAVFLLSIQPTRLGPPIITNLERDGNQRSTRKRKRPDDDNDSPVSRQRKNPLV